MSDKPGNLSESLKQNLQGVDVQQLISQAETLFIDAGKAKARANALDEKRKRVRSTIYVQFRNLGKSQADCEHLAIADSRYQDIVDECERANFQLGFHASCEDNLGREAQKPGGEGPGDEQRQHRDNQNRCQQLGKTLQPCVRHHRGPVV